MSRLLAGIVFLAALCAGLVQVGHDLWQRAKGIEVSEPKKTGPTIEPGREVQSAAGVPDIERSPLSSYRQTTLRPIFFEGRQLPEGNIPKAPSPPTAAMAVGVVVPPPVASPTPTSPVMVVRAAATIDGLKVLGVMVMRERSRALIDGGSSEPEWLSVGGKVREWSIVAIRPDGVQLRHGSQQATLALHKASTESSQR